MFYETYHPVPSPDVIDISWSLLTDDDAKASQSVRDTADEVGGVRSMR